MHAIKYIQEEKWDLISAVVVSFFTVGTAR